MTKGYNKKSFKKFDLEKFAERLLKVKNEAKYIAKDIGKAYYVTFTTTSSFTEPCYIYIKDELLYIVTTVTHLSTNWYDLKKSSTARLPEKLENYGDVLIRLGKEFFGSTIYHYICLSKEQMQLLSDTKAEQRQREKEFQVELKRKQKADQAELKQKQREKKIELLLTVENHSKEILENKKIYLMLYNLFDKDLTNYFWDITIFNPYKDDLIAEILQIEKISKYRINEVARINIEKVMNKFINLLVGKKYTSIDLQGKLGLLVMVKALECISVDYYSKKFSDSYSGYFVELKKMNFQQCINTYFSIDLIDKNDSSNISLFTYFLIENKKINKQKNKDQFTYGFEKVKNQIDLMLKNNELDQYELQLLEIPNSKNDKITIDDVDLLNGNEFEQFICDLFKKMGYSVNQTKSTGDQGIDVIAAKRGQRIGIQTKCYSTSVSNKAIQEVVAGINHYKLSKGMVITNNFFTKSAIELGNSNGVVLWDRSILKEKIVEYY
ncbi:restriction endonuclease [Metabacillus fastidiosus]|uniref:restriction endonuclease n=1 Tax=Metabacillus fastidiosus TaxID=1458 RepID=UPI002E1DECD1|nr:restriction endonuclease [Metabacillus fastidiosus]